MPQPKNRAEQATKLQSTPPTLGSTPDWKIGLWLAWDGWLKNLLFIASAILLVALFLFGIVPDWVLGVTVLALGLVVPIGYLGLELTRRADISLSRKALLFGSALLVLGASAYPPLMALVGQQQAEVLAFHTENETLSLPGKDRTEADWLVEVMGKMEQTAEPYNVSYQLKVHNAGTTELVKGALVRSWSKVRIGYKTKGKKLSDQDHKVHRFTADLSPETTVTLSHFSGKLNGPLEVLFRPEPVTWFHILAVDVPLILFAGILDTVEPDKKRGVRFASLASFMLILGSVFADNWMPGVWFNAVMLSVLAAFLGSMLFGFVIEKLLRPLARRIQH